MNNWSSNFKSQKRDLFQLKSQTDLVKQSRPDKMHIYNLVNFNFLTSRTIMSNITIDLVSPCCLSEVTHCKSVDVILTLKFYIRSDNIERL